jgi:Tfp pilus assembly protein PilF
MPLHKSKKPANSKAGIKPTAGKNGKQPNGKSSVLSAAKVQYNAFERGIAFLHKKSYREAKELFEKAMQGPSRAIAANAGSHVRICEQRLSPGPEPKSVEERYNYAIALLNLRNLEPARRHLAIALEMDPRADHVHYAMAVCRALSGDASGAYDSLRRAIELQPRNRMVARQDSDLDGISSQPRFSHLLYP